MLRSRYLGSIFECGITRPWSSNPQQMMHHIYHESHWDSYKSDTLCEPTLVSGFKFETEENGFDNDWTEVPESSQCDVAGQVLCRRMLNGAPSTNDIFLHRKLNVTSHA